MSELEADDNVIARIGESLAGAQSGHVQGVLCICFMHDGQVKIQVAGAQSLLERLGALSVCADAIKLAEMQRQNAQAQGAMQFPTAGNA